MLLSRRLFLTGALATFAAATPAHADSCRLDLIAKDESAHRNIPNYLYGTLTQDGRKHTAGGHWQITDTDWLAWAPRVELDPRIWRRARIDLAVWPNALSAPEDVQGQVAGIMCAGRGYMPWVPYNRQLRADLATFSDTPVSPPPHTQARDEPAPRPVAAKPGPKPHQWHEVTAEENLDVPPPR